MVINVSGMWLRRDVKAAYVFTRAFIKEKGLGGMDPKLVKKKWENLVHKYKVRQSPIMSDKVSFLIITLPLYIMIKVMLLLLLLSMYCAQLM